SWRTARRYSRRVPSTSPASCMSWIRRFFSSDIVIPFRAWGPKISSHNGRKSQGITPDSFDGQIPSILRNHPARSPHPAAKPLRPIGARQQLGLTLPEPLTGLAAMAFGARPVPAAVVVPERLIAVVEPSPQLWRAAGGDVRKCPLLRGHHPVAVLGRVLRTEPADNVRQLDVRLGWVNARINHGWASFPRRGRRWSGTAACEAGPAAARSGGCRSPWSAGSNGRARSG